MHTSMARYFFMLPCIMLVILCHASIVMSAPLLAKSPPPHELITGIRGGAKRPHFGAMIKAFWLTLVDPANEESLKYKKDKAKKDGQTGKGAQVKGRSLKD